MSSTLTWHYPVTSVTPDLREIPASARQDMRVPARVYADDTLWEQIEGDRSLDQLVNVATLRGVTGCVYGMPDIHEGYGFPVGGVAAFRASDGVQLTDAPLDLGLPPFDISFLP